MYREKNGRHYRTPFHRFLDRTKITTPLLRHSYYARFHVLRCCTYAAFFPLPHLGRLLIRRPPPLPHSSHDTLTMYRRKSLERYPRTSCRRSQQLLGHRWLSWDSSGCVRPGSATPPTALFLVGGFLPSRQRPLSYVAPRVCATPRECASVSGVNASCV